MLIDVAGRETSVLLESGRCSARGLAVVDGRRTPGGGTAGADPNGRTYSEDPVFDSSCFRRGDCIAYAASGPLNDFRLSSFGVDLGDPSGDTQ